MSDAANNSARGRLIYGILGAAAGLVVGAGLASVVWLVYLRSLERRGDDQAADVLAHLSTEEVLDYLVGKPLPLPDNLNGAGKPATIIQRDGVKQLTWESAMSLGGSRLEHHHYALLYDAGETRYFAEIDIDVRQVGEKRAYLGARISNVRKVEKIVDANPK